MVASRFIQASTVCLAMAVTPAMAELSLEAGAYFQQLKYTEFSQLGSELDKDEGVLAGPHIGLNWHTDRATFKLGYRYLTGDLDYSSIVANSQVKASSKQLTAGVETFFPVNEKIQLSILGEFATNSYLRDIASSGLYFGLNETYNHHFVSLGIGIYYQLNDKQSLNLSGSLIESYQSTLEVEFLSEEFDRVKFDMDEPEGFNIKLQWIQGFSRNWRLSIEYQYSYLETDRSANVPLFNNGLATNHSVSEPASDVTRSSLSLKINKRL